MSTLRTLGFTVLITASVAVLAAGCGSEKAKKSSDSKSKSDESSQTTSKESDEEKSEKADKQPELTGGTPVAVTIGEMYIKLTKPSIPSGKYRFNFTNEGKVEHEVVFLKTDTLAKDLKVTDDRVSEDDSVGEVADIEPGGKKSGTFQLEPGHYAVVCNLAGHYAGGMFVDLTVT